MVTIPFKFGATGDLLIPVKIINPKNNKSISIMLKVDTGYTFTTLDPKTARLLALDTKDSLGIKNGKYGYFLKGVIGNIPLNLAVMVRTSESSDFENILGMTDLHKFHKVSFTRTALIIEPKPKTTAAYVYANVPAWYKGRI